VLRVRLIRRVIKRLNLRLGRIEQSGEPRVVDLAEVATGLVDLANLFVERGGADLDGLLKLGVVQERQQYRRVW
jgi:hypothetical protein